MPVRYKIIESKKLVYALGSDTVTLSDLMSHMDELSHDPNYKAPMKKLVDYRQITHLDLSMEESELFAIKKAELKETFHKEKCAIVATKDINYGTARVHNALIDSSGIETAVFRDLNKALAWLEIELNDDELIPD
jgi:hypothetical protein